MVLCFVPLREPLQVLRILIRKLFSYRGKKMIPRKYLQEAMLACTY